MASNTKKWPSLGGTLSEQLGLNTTASDSLLLPSCPWALRMETCHHFCHGLGKSGVSVPVRAWTKQTREQTARSRDQYPGAPCCCLQWEPFFALPGWGCLRCQWQWWSQPGTGRGWQCSLLLGAAPGLCTSALPAPGLGHHGSAFFEGGETSESGSAFPEYPAVSHPQVWQQCLSTDVCGASPALQKCKDEFS